MAVLQTEAPGRDRTGAQDRRDALAAFLRSRRERITPQDVGLVTSGRRRTPGLRREEVAQLAGVGVTWYTWLEQARDIAPSAQVLDAISRTLRLDSHERTHLFRLADAPDPASVETCYAVPDSVRALLERLEPYPASVVNGRYDLLAYNRTYQALVGDLDSLAPGDRNVLWRTFTSPQARVRMVDWEEVARRMVASFRAEMAKHMGEPAWRCFLSRMLEASPEFAEIWERHEVAPLQRSTKQLLAPSVGLLQLETTSLWVAESVGVRLVAYTPLDDETRERLETLHAQAG
ncbi:MAG TPA: helix-turn-helix transcriptional regulator [Candidatus Eisenbacteria bacterium]|nr:helix-turn-helix transcriptional regulator [Candidatus Eisenbacteria bacterium]